MHDNATTEENASEDLDLYFIIIILMNLPSC